MELESQRVIGRDEFQSPLSSRQSSPDSELLELFKSQGKEHAGVPERYQEDKDDQGAAISQASAEDNLISFRLFATRSNAQPQTVRIESPSTQGQNLGFVVASRPDGYYFANYISNTDQEQFALSAVEGCDVIRRSLHRYHGCALPWRVTKIKAWQDRTGDHGTGPNLGGSANEGGGSPRKKPGKKRRIAIRVKRAAAAARSLEKERLEADKEAAEREKRTRRNREKKVRKKQKEKAKKAALMPD